MSTEMIYIVVHVVLMTQKKQGNDVLIVKKDYGKIVKTFTVKENIMLFQKITISVKKIV